MPSEAGVHVRSTQSLMRRTQTVGEAPMFGAVPGHIYISVPARCRAGTGLRTYDKYIVFNSRRSLVVLCRDKIRNNDDHLVL